MSDSIYAIEAIAISLLETLPELTSGTNLFEGPIRPVSDAGVAPATAVFVLASGGPAPIAYQDGSDSSASYREARLQVWVRSIPKSPTGGGYLVGKSLARKCYKILEKPNPSGTIGIRADQAAPIYIGQESDGSDIWSLNFTVYQRS